MAVSVDAVANVVITTGQASISGATFGLTVGATATFLLVLFEVDVVNTPLTCVWDNGGTNQSMTIVGTVITGSQSVLVLFGLVNPTAGNKAIIFNSLNNGAAYATGISFKGTVTTSVALAIEGFNGASGTGTSATTTTITSIPTGDMAVGWTGNQNGYSNGFTPGTNPGDGGTAIGKNESATSNCAAEYYSGAGSTITTAMAQAGSGFWTAVIVGIKAPGAAGDTLQGSVKIFMM